MCAFTTERVVSRSKFARETHLIVLIISGERGIGKRGTFALPRSVEVQAAFALGSTPLLRLERTLCEGRSQHPEKADRSTLRSLIAGYRA